MRCRRGAPCRSPLANWYANQDGADDAWSALAAPASRARRAGNDQTAAAPARHLEEAGAVIARPQVRSRLSGWGTVRQWERRQPGGRRERVDRPDRVAFPCVRCNARESRSENDWTAAVPRV